MGTRPTPEQQKSRYWARKQKCLQYLGGKCQVCGSTEDLQFDHIDPATKEFNISNASAFKWERVEAELKKCQLLCAPCHSDKTTEDIGGQNSKRRHGTPRSYRHCKCETCTAVYRNYMREYMRKKRASLV